MHRHDHLRHGGHPHHVGPDHAQEPVLGPGLQVRTRHGHVNALLGGEVLAPGDFQGPIDQLPVVGLDHVGEAGPQRIVVHADQRVAEHQVDVVLDDHDVPLGELRVHPAAGVGDDQKLGPQGLHHAHREGDLPVRVALVGMETPLHGHHGDPLHLAAQQPPGVGDRRRAGEMGDRFVLERGLGVDLPGQTAEAGPQDDPGVRPPLPVLADRGDGLLDLGGKLQHR